MGRERAMEFDLKLKLDDLKTIGPRTCLDVDRAVCILSRDSDKG